MSRERALEAAIGRHSGMDEGRQEVLKTALEAFPDWWGRCRKCKKVVEGTPAQLRGHVCGPTD